MSENIGSIKIKLYGTLEPHFLFIINMTFESLDMKVLVMCQCKRSNPGSMQEVKKIIPHLEKYIDHILQGKPKIKYTVDDLNAPIETSDFTKTVKTPLALEFINTHRNAFDLVVVHACPMLDIDAIYEMIKPNGRLIITSGSDYDIFRKPMEGGTKLDELSKYSNLNEVKKRASRHHIKVQLSTRKNKKYMVYDGKKMIHFGQMGYEDFTKHKDKNRLKHFRTRNRMWANEPKYSPGWLSYHLLW